MRSKYMLHDVLDVCRAVEAAKQRDVLPPDENMKLPCSVKICCFWPNDVSMQLKMYGTISMRRASAVCCTFPQTLLQRC